MKRKLNYLSATLFGLLPMFVNANEISHSTPTNTITQQEKCSNTTLYRELTPSQRTTIMSPVDQPLFASNQYCIGHFDYGAQQKSTLTTNINGNDAYKISRRYTRAYDSLKSHQAKVAFIHIYLQQLSRFTTVLPSSRDDNSLNVVLPVNNQSSDISFVKQKLTPKSEEQAIVQNGLTALIDTSISDQQWPQLTKLVQWVIGHQESKTSKAQLPVNVIQDPTDGSCWDDGDSSGAGGGCDAANPNNMTYAEWQDWAEDNEKAECDLHLCNLVYEDDAYGQPCYSLMYPDGHMIELLYCWAGED